MELEFDSFIVSVQGPVQQQETKSVPPIVQRVKRVGLRRGSLLKHCPSRPDTRSPTLENPPIYTFKAPEAVVKTVVETFVERKEPLRQRQSEPETKRPKMQWDQFVSSESDQEDTLLLQPVSPLVSSSVPVNPPIQANQTINRQESHSFVNPATVKPFKAPLVQPPETVAEFDIGCFESMSSQSTIYPSQSSIYPSQAPQSQKESTDKPKRLFKLNAFKKPKTLSLDLTPPKAERTDSIQQYQMIMKDCLIEYIQLQINDAVKTLSKDRIYNCSLEKFQVKSEYTQKERQRHYLITLDHKERNAYAKRDIWILTNQEKTQSCVFYSYFHGPNSNLELELVPFQEPKFYASQLVGMHLLNAQAELMALETLESQDFIASPVVRSFFKPIRTTSVVRVDKRQQFRQIVQTTTAEHKLNQDQAQAVTQFLEKLIQPQECTLLVHGVFGAGKSYMICVLIIIVSKLFQAGCFLDSFNPRIAVASMTNVAVDRILTLLLKMGFSDFVRVGNLKKIHKSILPFTCQGLQSKDQEQKDLEMLLQDQLTESERRSVQQAIQRFKRNENSKIMYSSMVVGITCMATQFEGLLGIECPIVILDEASQLTEPMSLLPICKLRASYTLLVGDPMQLMPTLLFSKKQENGLEQSLFQRLLNAGSQPIMLKTQYRCHPMIANVSNQLFYGNQLLTGCERSQLIPGLDPLVLVRLDSKTENLTNQMESDLIVRLLDLFVQRVDPTDIGVISIYRAQANQLKQRTSHLEGITCSTVDAFQGAEKEIILISLCRQDPSQFLQNRKRINVALTRSKSHLVVVGTQNVFYTPGLWSEIDTICPSIDSQQLFQNLC